MLNTDILIAYISKIYAKHLTLLRVSFDVKLKYGCLQMKISKVHEIEPNHEKTGILHMHLNRSAVQLWGNQKAFLLHMLQFLNFLNTNFQASVAVQPGWCWAWSETPKYSFLTWRLSGFKIHLYCFSKACSARAGNHCDALGITEIKKI